MKRKIILLDNLECPPPTKKRTLIHKTYKKYDILPVSIITKPRMGRSAWANRNVPVRLNGIKTYKNSTVLANIYGTSYYHIHKCIIQSKTLYGKYLLEYVGT